MRTHSIATLVCTATAVVVTAALGACVSIAGLEDYPARNPNRGLCGGFVYADADCTTCVDNGLDGGPSCCDQANTCRADAICAAYFDCVSPCSRDDAACRVACSTKFPTAASDAAVEAFTICRNRSCNDTCGNCGAAYEFLGADCAACAREQCCDQTIACLADDRCAQEATCFASCGDPYCGELCTVKFPSDTLIPSASCVTAGCAACNLGQHYSCVGAYKPQVPVSGVKVSIDIDLVTVLGTTPVPNATVLLCADVMDPACRDGVSVGKTDATGNRTFDQELSPNIGFVGYFKATGGGIIDTLIVPPLPLVEDTYFGTPIVTKELLNDAYLFAYAGITPPKTPSAGKGAIAIVTRDCLGIAAAGLTFALPNDPDASRFLYLKSDQGIALGGPTDAAGTAAVVNVEPGEQVELVATIQALQTVFNTVTVPVRGNTLTVVKIYPSTAP